MLGMLAEKSGVGVGKDEYTMIAPDGARFVASITRKARVRGGIDIECANFLPGLETWRDGEITFDGHAFGNKSFSFFDRECGSGGGSVGGGCATLQFFGSDKFVFDEHFEKCDELALVVAEAKIIDRRDKFDGVTAGIDVPFAPSPHGASQGEDAPLPGVMEDRLVGLGFYRAHVLHAAHVMDAIHFVSAFAGDETFVTPIMESRVTSAASSSSVRCSVPAGRSGRIR